MASATGSQGSAEFYQNGDEIRLYNGQVSVTVDCKTGRASSLINSSHDVDWLARAAVPLALSFSNSSSVWTASEATTVRPSRISPTKCKVKTIADGKAIQVSFNEVRAGEHVLALEGSYEVAIFPESEQTRWNLTLRNKSTGVIVSVYYPFLDGLQPGPTAELMRPYMAGLRTRLNDRTPPISDHYPHPLSMPFIDVGDSDHGLYLASHQMDSSSLKIHVRNLDRFPPSFLTKNGWGLAIERFPFIQPSQAWRAPNSVIMPHDGDWRASARTYRRFYQKHFPSIDKNELLDELTELSSFHFKTPWNKDYRPKLGFARLVKDLEKTKSASSRVRALRLDGWYQGGYDSFLPSVRPLQELGGKAAFKTMIARARLEGIRVYPYLNPRLLDREDDESSALRERCAMRGPSNEFYTETYHYQEPFGVRTGVVMCPRCEPWLQQIQGTADYLIDDVGVPGLYIDQLGIGVDNDLFCFDKTHGHSTPADIWGPAAVSLAARLHERGRTRDPDFLLVTEANFDRLYPYVELPFSWSDQDTLRPDPISLPALELFRYTFNDLGQQKMYSHRWSSGVADALAVANVIDSGGHPIRRLMDRAPDVFNTGRYIDQDGLNILSGDARAVSFVGPKRFAVIVRPTSLEQASVSVVLRLNLADMGVNSWPHNARFLFSADKSNSGSEVKLHQREGLIKFSLPHASLPAIILLE